MADSSSLSMTNNSINGELEKVKSVEEFVASLPKASNGNEILEKMKSVRELISTLPKGKGWITHQFYQYQGFWYVRHALPGTILAQQNFKAQSTDIILATNPKCGTTWLKSLAFAIKNRATTPAPQLQKNNDHPSPLLTSNSHALVPNLEYGTSLLNHYFLEDEVETTLPSPARLIATHIPYSSLPESVSNSSCRVVYMSREPKDVFVSMRHFYEKFNHKEVPIISFQETFDLFCEGISYFGPYWDHVRGYYEASLERPEKVMFLKYEDMQSDTLNQVKRLAEFLGYPFSLEEETKEVVEEIIQLCSFENMSNLEVNKKGKLFGKLGNDIFFRKGKVGDSKNYLTAEMVERLDEITKEKFQGLDIGY